MATFVIKEARSLGRNHEAYVPVTQTYSPTNLVLLISCLGNVYL